MLPGHACQFHVHTADNDGDPDDAARPANTSRGSPSDFVRTLTLTPPAGCCHHTTLMLGLFGNFGQANASAAKAGRFGLTRTTSIGFEKLDATGDVHTFIDMGGAHVSKLSTRPSALHRRDRC